MPEVKLTPEQEQFMQSVNASVKAKLEAFNNDKTEENKAAVVAEVKTQVEAYMDGQPKLEDAEALLKLSQRIQALEVPKTSAAPKSTTEAIVAKHDEIMALKSDGNEIEFDVEAAVTRPSVADNELSTVIPGIGQLATRTLAMTSLFRSVFVNDKNNNATVRYSDWDAATTARAAATIAEGGTYPKSDAKWVQKTLQLVKIGDSIEVSEEFIEDANQFAREIDEFLRINVDLEEDEQLYEGDGTGSNVLGYLLQIPEYTLVQASVANATIYDLIRHAKAQITSAGGRKYRPNYVMMNSNTNLQMQEAKDDNGNYIQPPFVNREGTMVDGLLIVINDGMADNTLSLGDAMYGKIYRKKGFVMSKNTSGTQFDRDMTSIKVRKRMNFLVREADKGGFRKISDVDAAVNALTLAPV